VNEPHTVVIISLRCIDNQTLFSVDISTTGKDWSANTGLTFSW
jgi:hypothetical protein